MAFFPVCVGRRIDALTLAYKIDVPAPVVAHLEGVREAAELSRQNIEVDVGALVGCASFVLACMPRSPQGSIVLRNGDVSVMVCPSVGHGWTVEVRVFAAFLAQHNEVETLRLARGVAGLFGPWDATVGERCRRIDLASDWTNWPLEDDDDSRLVTRPRAKRTRFRPTREELATLPASRAFHVARDVTGLAVAYGSPVMGRIYDKSAELDHAGSEGKRAFEEAFWHAQGWDGARVTRVEFQLRGDVLYEMGLRDNVDGLFDRVDGVWQYLTKDWLTMRLPETASRLCRAQLDPRWKAVQALRWGPSGPVERVRRRGGASMPQSLGCVVSHLAATGSLEEGMSSQIKPNVVEVMRMDDGAASALLRSMVTRVCLLFALAVETGMLVTHKSPQEAAASFVQRVAGSTARFGVVSDERLMQFARAG